MKKIIVSFIEGSIKSLLKFKKGRSIVEYILNTIRSEFRVVKHDKYEFKISTPNQLCFFRAETFSTKEPETLEWIDEISENSVFWDIGANVGLYSMYAAKKKQCSVYAFEPSIFNLELLSRNIFINDLTSLVTIIPLPLNDKNSINKLQLTTFELGGALSTFEHKIGFDGKYIQEVFDFSVIGISMDFAHFSMGIPQPDFIKMDVDGIEHFILLGGEEVLKKVKGLLIEVNDNFQEQAELCTQILTRNGLKMIEKRHSEEFEKVGALGDGKIWNQIWKRL